MEMEYIEYRTPIDAKQFLDGYLCFGIRNRKVAATALFAGWQEKDQSDQMILGGKVLAEYIAAVEELFAFMYAIGQEGLADHGGQDFIHSEFMEALFHYESRQVHQFIKAHNFRSSLLDIFRFPSSACIARSMKRDEQEVEDAVHELSEMIEQLKDEYYGDLLKIFNKLKHPFLTLPPWSYRSGERNVLPVITRSASRDDIAAIYPLGIDEPLLDRYLNNILNVAAYIELLVRCLYAKYNLSPESPHATPPRHQ